MGALELTVRSLIYLLVSEILSEADAKELLRLCKLGRLYDVQGWTTSGKSLCLPSNLRTTPLKVALDTGFHSLVELLVRNEPNQELKDRALSHAVSLKRLDFIQLLNSHGADLSSIPFIEVLRIWEPTIIRFFLDHGADFIQDSPFAVAFGERIRTAIGAWRKCKEKHPECASQLQEQADRALRHFCEKEDLKWVSLLMWAGADPRSSGPSLDYDGGLDDSDDSEDLTALAAAANAKNPHILRRLKPDKERDDIDKLLVDAATFGREDTVRYLLELGANPNDNPTVAPQLSMDVYQQVLDAKVSDGRYPLAGTFLLPRHRSTQFPKRSILLNSCLNMVPCCDQTTIKRMLALDEVYLNANRT